MSNVTLVIGGREFAVACGAGEEEHIAMLGRTIDGKIAAMPNLVSQSEPRMLLYAALLLADELAELRRSAVPAAAPQDDERANQLEAMAERLEYLADRLESAGAAS
ncbi:conserved hypothetical protein [Altererythrobacter sp. B11]|uniref:cell division protein ZapA n=1 Tax=Altererythrobacter sp. B11 TaxID=2060312 RepID=UPI000DC71029|nr:cell division protein ZapA [Altererythrobacter sp. B11]BBC72660.1 conserved hypothetical protein [Altererythrobacter sp. B11]